MYNKIPIKMNIKWINEYQNKKIIIINKQSVDDKNNEKIPGQVD